MLEFQTILIVAIFIGQIIIVFRKSPKVSDTIIKDMPIGNDISLCSDFSEKVKEVYKIYITQPNIFTISDNNTTVQIRGTDIIIWAANEKNNRKFYASSHGPEWMKKANSELTQTDLILLDKICKSVKKKRDFIESNFNF